jgi:hypothetical protein
MFREARTQVQPGFAHELWRPAEQLPEYVDWVQAPPLRVNRANDEPAGPVSVDPEWELILMPLNDLLAAAGRVEWHLLALRQLATEAGGVARGLTGPDLPTRFGAWQVDAAYDEWLMVLWWCRAFEERLDRRGPSNSDTRRGVLNALADGEIATDLRDRLGELRAGTLRDVRALANLTLHRSLLPRAGSRTAAIQDSGVVLPIPDEATGQIDFPERLSYVDGRDAVTHAERVFAAIGTFVDALIDHLENGTYAARSARPRDDSFPKAF